jgi:hypothetical protein
VTDWNKIRERFPNESVDRIDAWETCRLSVSVDKISYFVATFEAYENHFQVRTEVKGLGLIRIWYAKPNRMLLNQILVDISTEVPFEILGYDPGMDALDLVFPE